MTDDPRNREWTPVADMTMAQRIEGIVDRGEHRITNAVTGGEKGQKLARFDLLPADALEALAAHYGKGAAKYEARNWERGYDWSLSFAALQRHLWAFWSGEDRDEEQNLHLAAAAFHVLALLHFTLDPVRYASMDDRP